MAVVDLHLHTTASDGRLTPTELINLVGGKGLQAVAVTDHDSTEGLAEAFGAAAAFPQLTLIPGIELSTDVPGNEIHLLGYFIQYDDNSFQETLKKFRLGRLNRGRGMVEKLREMGFAIEWERVQQIAGEGAVGRPHVARAMLEKGYIRQLKEAFDQYIGRNGPAYVEREKLTAEQSISMIGGLGGAAVLAHPAYLPDLDNTVKELKGAGLVGMEVYYTEYTADKIQELADVAAEHGMLPCGGSDYHAQGTPGESMPGTMGPPLEVVERLKARVADRNRAK